MENVLRKDSLWAKVILSKYCSLDKRRARDSDKLPGSSSWTAIKVGFPIFEKGIGWSVGDGRKIKVWSDCWIRDVSLRDLIVGPLTQNESDLLLSDLLIEQGQGWRWEVLSFELPQDVKDKIRAIPLSQVGRREDFILWKLSKDGDFSSRTAYALANSSHFLSNDFQGVWIWELDVLPKVISFLWLCMHRSVPVKNTLVSRGIIEEDSCPLCKRMPETIEHLLRECVYACDFWSKVNIPPMVVSSFQATVDVIEWLWVNCLSKAMHHSLVPWRYIFPSTVWELWKHRNKVVFENIPLNINLYRTCISQAMEFYYCVGKINKQRRLAGIQVC